MLKVIHFILC